MHWTAIARGRAFADGNKRTAILAALIFLRRNGLKTIMRPDLEEAALQAASGDMPAQALAEYLKKSFGD